METVYHTAKGLKFGGRVVGNELFVDQKAKAITRASLSIAYKKWTEDRNCGPKKMNVFGASYLWRVFKEIDVTGGADDNDYQLKKENVNVKE